MRLSLVYVFCLFIGNCLFSQEIHNRSLNYQYHATTRLSSPSETEGGTLCPTTIPLIAKDSLVYATSGTTSIASGSTLNCLTRSFYLYTNTSGAFIDSVKSDYTPALELVFDSYQPSLATYGTVTFYEGSSNIGCIGPSGCSFPIGGTVTPTAGTKWSLFLSELDPALAHTFVFSKTNSITTTTVSIKSPWLASTITTFTWSNSTANSYSVTIPANTASMGSCNFVITPTVSANAFTDYHYGYCKLSPRQMPLGTYTVTYTLRDTVCTSKTANYIFTVGLPNVSWVTPHPCLPGATINLTTQLSASAVTGGTWSGTGVSGTTFSPASAGLGTFNVTYAVGTGTCSNSSTNALTVNTTPTVNVTSGSYCPGGSTSLVANGATTYSWSPTTSLSGSGSSVFANPSSTTIYTVIGTSNFCNSYATSTVTVFPQPVAAFNANPQTTFITSPNVSFTDATTGATISNWSWNFGDGNTSSQQNPANNYAAVGDYNVQLVVISNKGCRDSVSHIVEIKADNITIYNSFSPNGDGLNDFFEIDNIDQFGKNHVYIYNRWGQLLWDKTGYDNKNVVWDGKDSKGVILTPGTYFYVVEVEGKKTEKHWLELTK